MKHSKTKNGINIERKMTENFLKPEQPSALSSISFQWKTKEKNRQNDSKINQPEIIWRGWNRENCRMHAQRI